MGPRQKTMSKKFIQITSGWIPVSILVLFAIAFVAGQARARVENEFGASAVPATDLIIVSGTQQGRDRESGRVVVDRIPWVLPRFRFSVEPQKIGAGSGEPWGDVPSL